MKFTNVFSICMRGWAVLEKLLRLPVLGLITYSRLETNMEKMIFYLMCRSRLFLIMLLIFARKIIPKKFGKPCLTLPFNSIKNISTQIFLKIKLKSSSLLTGKSCKTWRQIVLLSTQSIFYRQNTTI